MSPVPDGWQLVGDDRLELMCRVAEEVPRHTGEMRRIPRPDDFPPAAAGADPGSVAEVGEPPADDSDVRPQ